LLVCVVSVSAYRFMERESIRSRVIDFKPPGGSADCPAPANIAKHCGQNAPIPAKLAIADVPQDDAKLGPALAAGKFHAFIPTIPDVKGPGTYAGKQTTYWQPAHNIWRYLANSYDPFNGDSREGEGVAKIDICKIVPAFCDGAKPAFCTVKRGGKDWGNMCCPKHAPAGCPAKAKPWVKGMPRSRMPQVWLPDEAFLDGPARTKIAPYGPKTYGKWIAYMKQGAADFDCAAPADVAVGELTPAQDEINFVTTYTKACDFDAQAPGVAKTPVITDNEYYIYDGHHRWSFFKLVNQHGKDAGQKGKAGKVPTVKCNKDIAWMIEHSLKAFAAGKPRNSNDPNFEFANGLLEIAARYGPTVQLTERIAREKWVRDMTEKLHAKGMEMRGGDQDLFDMWDEQYSQIWN